MKSVQFERKVNIAHDLQWVFFDSECAVDTFLYRQKNNKWDDTEGRDALRFMKHEADLFISKGGEPDEEKKEEGPGNESDGGEVEVVEMDQA